MPSDGNAEFSRELCNRRHLRKGEALSQRRAGLALQRFKLRIGRNRAARLYRCGRRPAVAQTVRWPLPVLNAATAAW